MTTKKKKTEISTELSRVIKGFISRLEKAEKFVLEQAPQICKEMIREAVFDYTVDLWLNVALLILCVIVATAGSYVACDDTKKEGIRVISGMLAIIGTIGFFPAICETARAVKYLYMVKKCPKLYLLREFKKLVE